jgi:hypothetical protein
LGLWAVNALLIFACTLGAAFNIQSAILAAISAVGQLFIAKFLE